MTLSSPEELEGLVSQGDYHGALQLLGRPSFTPGDGSWTEWIYCQMHAAESGAHHLHLHSGGHAAVSVHEFLHQVAAQLPPLSVDDHERHWRCYYELCLHFERPVLAVAYHTTFLQTHPQDLCISLTRRSDLPGLDIVLKYFPMGCTALLMEMPPTVPASQYAHLIPWGAEGVQEFLQAHIQRRFEQTGMIMDWIEEVAEEMGTGSTFYRYLADQYRSVLQLEAPLEPLTKNLTAIPEEDDEEDSPIPTLRKESPTASRDSTLPEPVISGSTQKEPSTSPEPSPTRKAPDTLEPTESIDDVAPSPPHLQRHSQPSEDISEPQQTEEHHPTPPTEALSSTEEPFAMRDAQDEVGDEIAEMQQPLDKESHIRQPFQSKNYATNAATTNTSTIIVEALHEQVQASQETCLDESEWRHELQQQVLRLEQESMEKDQLIQQLQQELEQLQHHFSLHKTADQARLDYLLTTSPPKAHRGESKTNQDVQQLAFALEVSERQRAQALDDLQEQRAFYADKMKHLQEAFRRMIREERLVGTPIVFGKNL